jgi:hypothetical protein
MWVLLPNDYPPPAANGSNGSNGGNNENGKRSD